MSAHAKAEQRETPKAAIISRSRRDGEAAHSNKNLNHRKYIIKQCRQKMSMRNNASEYNMRAEAAARMCMVAAS